LIIEGYGLHTGRAARVVLTRSEGPTTLATSEAEARIDELVVVDATRSTTVATRDGRLRIATVEHLFAALAAFDARDGVRVTIDGPEIPLADGGASTFADAIANLDLPRRRSSLSVIEKGAITIGTSTYELEPASRVVVEAVFEEPRFGATARWEGDSADFRTRIAPARTFGFTREIDELLERGLARHVTPESVVVLGDFGALSRGAPFLEDEPARHKLLDLVGDLFVHGGPPIGFLRATRPAHRATHEAMTKAMDLGIVRAV
jgi:UDP-3-O-[3-hydroxymyristoyl] N-acetylglucosamine deacetylase